MAPIEDKIYTFTDSTAQQGFERIFHPSLALNEYILTVAMEEYDRELGKVHHSNHYLKGQLRRQIFYGMNFIASAIMGGLG